MNLSQNAFEQMLTNGSIRSTSGLDLKKCRLQTDAILIIDKWTIESQSASA